MTPDQTFGKMLKEHRSKHGYTLRELAEKVGYNFAYLSQLEADVAKPSEELVKELAKLFKVTPQEEEEMLFLARGVPKQIAEIKEKFPNVAPAYFRRASKKTEGGT